MTRFVSLLATLISLGFFNIIRVFVYRVGIKTRLNSVCRLRSEIPQGPFFYKHTIEECATSFPRPVGEWWEVLHYFGVHPVSVTTTPPDWHANPISGLRMKGGEQPWWEIPDFDPDIGDIKVIWEASRFDWVLAFAQHLKVGTDGAHERLETWLNDWLVHNPPYRGVNWKCGQEASIRVMHLAMAALLLGQELCTQNGLLDLIEMHLQRIAPTMGYAVAQDNNHGTSEAAALFIGGSWLALQRPESRGTFWAKLGRNWLENRVARLIMPDGGFSQYSVNYHRVLLDTLSMVEVWRRAFQLPEFDGHYLSRVQAAVNWLRSMVRPGGDAPNFGANDGARLLPLSDTPYRDFRPSVQLSSVLFCHLRAFDGEGEFNAPLRWLGIKIPELLIAPTRSEVFDQSGFAVFSKGAAFALLHYPRFQFRPGQADVLHLDFWLGGENFLRDAGTFSYNCEAEWLTYFSGTAAHNTVQFDGRDQMPRISRFLFADWLRPNPEPEWNYTVEADQLKVGYKDGQGARHLRCVTLSERQLDVVDDVSGFNSQAVLRWRLIPGEWVLDGNILRLGSIVLAVTADVPIARLALIVGQESRHYLQRTDVPVLEIEVHIPARISTVIKQVA